VGTVVLIVLGPAGSGKSTLVSTYSKWLLSNGYSVTKVNLDPAADYLPYIPDYDVRDFVSARELAIREGLGPNSALLVAMDRVCNYLSDLINYLVKVGSDYVLIDTPGQMEVFLFREVSSRLVSELRRGGFSSTYALFVVGADLIRDSRDYVLSSLMALATQLRLDVDSALVINKVDVFSESVSRLSGDLIRDYEVVINGLSTESLYSELLKELLPVITKYLRSTEVPKVSALKGYGMEELHRLVHELSCVCGDLT